MNLSSKFHVFKYGSLTVVEVPLTQKEIEECLEMGKRRTELDEKKLGWGYRFDGIESERAHAIGLMGELGFEKLLNALDLEQRKDYVRNDPFVKRYEDIEQDFRIGASDVGVKSADKDSLREATRYDSFLYPAKKEKGASKRILPYPDYLVQTVVSVNKKKCWICGFVHRKTIEQSPVRWIREEPAHVIPIREYKSVKSLINLLRSS